MFCGANLQYYVEYSHIQTQCGEYFVEYCQSHINNVMDLNNVMNLQVTYLHIQT